MKQLRLRGLRPALAATLATLLATGGGAAAIASTPEASPTACVWEGYDLTGTTDDALCDVRQSVAAGIAATASNISFAVSNETTDEGITNTFVNGELVLSTEAGSTDYATLISSLNKINTDYLNSSTPTIPTPEETEPEAVEEEAPVEEEPAQPVVEEEAAPEAETPAVEDIELVDEAPVQVTPFAAVPGDEYIPARDTICVSDFDADTVDCEPLIYRDLAPAVVPTEQAPLPENVSAPHITAESIATNWDSAASQGSRSNAPILIDPSQPEKVAREYKIDFGFFNTAPDGANASAKYRVVGFYGETLTPSSFTKQQLPYENFYEGTTGSATYTPEFTRFGVDADLSDSDFTAEKKNITATFSMNPTGTIHTDGVLNAVMYEAQIFAVVEARIGEETYHYTVGNTFGSYSSHLVDLAHFSNTLCEDGAVCIGGEIWGMNLGNQHTLDSLRGPDNPPVVTPPTEEPPVVNPPVVEPPVVTPPTVEPPVEEPPTAAPPVVDSPLAATGMDMGSLLLIGTAAVGLVGLGGFLLFLHRRRVS